MQRVRGSRTFSEVRYAIRNLFTYSKYGPSDHYGHWLAWQKRPLPNTQMTYGELCRLLFEGGVEDFTGEAALLAERLCRVSRARFITNRACPLSHPLLEDAVERRVNGEPLQYILGEWDFYGETYRVTPDCLIPRSDTEILVEKAIKLLPENGRFADLCTGSGCIAVSTLAHRPDCTAHAVDLFPRTVALAAENAERNGVKDRLSLSVADVLDPACLTGEPLFDAIFSNPPYIRTAVIETLERELFREPRAALDGGEDGLIFYRTIVKNLSSRLSEKGFFLFEIGYDQEDDIRQIAAQNGFLCTVEKDLGGNPRVALLYR